ncbi:fibroblast growth factor-binding protein 1-like [Antennarius striatus]|uniref:fibroblast growth factor-binding protein 1-like n=1 Tax=Antennarius striatus TaxID=241820 RepID=UPI0035B24EF2
MEVRKLRQRVVPGMVGVSRHFMYEKPCGDHGEPQRSLGRSIRQSYKINYPLKEDMALLRTFALWLLLAFLGQQVSPSFGVRHSSRGGSRSRGAAKNGTVAPGGAPTSWKRSTLNGRGKFDISDEMMQCSWTSKDVADTVRVQVKCENTEARISGGVTDLMCRYEGKPQQCRGYQSNPKGFWKQVGRAFKKLQGKVCRDERTLVKASMCKRATRDAHFKLDIGSSVVSAQSGGMNYSRPPPRTTTLNYNSTTPKNCTGRVDVQKKAEQHCSASWSSLCAFFFSMLQSDAC